MCVFEWLCARPFGARALARGEAWLFLEGVRKDFPFHGSFAFGVAIRFWSVVHFTSTLKKREGAFCAAVWLCVSIFRHTVLRSFCATVVVGVFASTVFR